MLVAKSAQSDFLLSHIARTISWGIHVTFVTVVSETFFLNGFMIYGEKVKNLAPMPFLKVRAESVRGQNPKWPPETLNERHM